MTKCEFFRNLFSRDVRESQIQKLLESLCERKFSTVSARLAIGALN
jgi:hypothetical protein